MLQGLSKIKMFLSFLSIFTICLFFGYTWNISLDHQGSRNCGCHTCLTDGDLRFRQIVNTAPNPFLSKTHRTTLEEYNWWKKLQYSSYDNSMFNATVDNLFKIFPPIPDVEGPNPGRCVSCAVVGNSGNLLRSHYGPLIDVNDVVIRMNHGRTKGFEEHVGAKTTHHIFYPESANRLENTTRLVLFAFKTKDLLWLINKFKPRVKGERIANKDLVMILNPGFMKYVHQIWLEKKGKYPSTGFMAFILSMYMCDQISVFGFGADSEGNWSHYYEILRNHKLRTGPHPGSHEYGIIQQLGRENKIRFYKGY